MPATTASPNPTASALRDALRELGQTSPNAHDRRTRRVAVAVAVRGGPGRRPDDLTDEPVPIADCRLYTLSHRWCRRHDGSARPAAPFALLRPEAAGGRVRYAPTRVVDLADDAEARRLKGDDARAAALLIRAIADAAPAELADALHLPVPILNPVAPAAEPLDGDKATGAEARAPKVARVAHLRGRTVRNPAFDVLRRHRIVPRRLGYRAWLTSLGLVADPRRTDGAGGHAPASALRDAISDYASSGTSIERALFDDLRVACRGAGIVVPAGDDGVDVLARLLDAPWERPAVPGAFVQVLALPAGPAPATMTFADAATTVDLVDLGAERARFEPATPAAIREALGR